MIQNVRYLKDLKDINDGRGRIVFSVVCLVRDKNFQRMGVSVPPSLCILPFEVSDAETGVLISEDAVLEICRHVDFILGSLPRLSARTLESARNLKLVQLGGSGYDKVDIEAAARVRIPVANVPGNSSAVAEYVILAAMTVYRHLIELDAGVKSGRYSEIRSAVNDAGMFELSGKTLGIVGLGRIGRDLARRARAFEMRVVYHNIVPRPAAEEQELGVQFMSLGDLLTVTDILTLNVPLTPQTRNLIGAQELGLLKPSSIVINAARGGIVDELALVDALASGKLAGAALDVYTTEPVPPNHPFLSLSPEIASRLVLTPHIAGITRESSARMMQMALDNMARVAQGLPPMYVVNGVGRP